MYTAGTFLAVTAPAWIKLLFAKTRKKFGHTQLIPIDDDVNEALPEARYEQVAPADSRHLAAGDAEYADKMQLEEAVRASMESIQDPVMLLENEEHNVRVGNTEPLGSENESTNFFCEICLEDKEIWQMFINDNCSHMFCYGCITSHIQTTIQDRVKNTITCPGVRCEATLNSDDCRMLIPDDALIQWDTLLCMSIIPEDSKMYCPFRDCLSLLLNDSDTGRLVGQVFCVACKRTFCSECLVPWHLDFTCSEFQKLNAKKGKKKDEKIVKSLAKKKNWQKCPKCRMLVEKSEGCEHITCRCKYEFCYTCGLKWVGSHGKCKSKSIARLMHQLFIS